MAGESLVIDPTSEDAANVALDLVDGTSYWLLAHDYPPPPKKAQYATPSDQDGAVLFESHYENREVTVELRVTGTSAADLHEKVGHVQQKMAKLSREGGTLERTAPSGLSIVFDVLEAEASVLQDARFVHSSRTQMALRFVCRPFGRGPAEQLADHAETTLPVLVFTEAVVPGDVPALGKLVVDEDDGDDQWFVIWGIQSRFYSADASAALFWQAEALTAQGGSATAVGPTGASGGGSNVMRNTALSTSYQSVLSTQATGGGAHMSHVGSFRVFARVQRPTTNTGSVSVALEWSEGDFRRVTTNAEKTWDADELEGVWTLVDLGHVHLSKVAQGTQRWEGRVLAKSTVVGDDIDIDCLFLVPTSEGSGEARAVLQIPAATSYVARDEFDQSAGALAAKALPVGGTWAGAGDADDFAVETTGHTAQRAATSDTAPRFALAGATTHSAVLVEADVKASAWGPASNVYPYVGVLARYVDTSNYVAAVIGAGSTGDDFSIDFRVVLLGSVSAFQVPISAPDVNTWYTIRLFVTANGRFYVWLSGVPVLQGSYSPLAAGAGLATGLVGLFDWNGGVGASTRSYDNFSAFVPAVDAAVFASQSLEVRHDRVIREDSSGAIWTPVSKYEGDYLLIPPSGREGRTTRVIVKASRNDPDTMSDPGIDDISARLTVTPRYLVIPDS